MSVNKFQKHQKSKYGKFMLISPDGDIILSTNSEKKFKAKQDELSKPARDRKAKAIKLAMLEE